MKKQIFNPYLPNYEYIPDGDPHVYEDRLYVYGSHDKFGSPFFCDNDYVLWSAPIDDLSDWTFHGTIFRKDQDPLNKKELHPLFAPDVVRGSDGRYYLYYAPSGTRSIGVAVSDKPYGPFEFLNHVKDTDNKLLGQRDYDPYPFDPAVLVENGHVYLYLGFSPDPSWDFLEKEFGNIILQSGAYIAELSNDMYTVISKPQKIEILNIEDKGHDFLEASSIRNFNGVYYFIYSSINSHELCYGMSDDPKGPFIYKGILHDNGDLGYKGNAKALSYTGNNHGSIEKIRGDYYIFGHRQSNYSTYARQGVAEKIYMNEDGTFNQVEMTSYGLSGKPLKPEGEYSASIACNLYSKDGALHYLDNCQMYENIRIDHPAFSQDGQDRESDPNQYIKNMKDGSLAGFKYFEYVKEIKLSVKTRGDEGVFEVRNNPDGSVLAEIKLNKNKDYTQSEEVIITFPEEERIALYFTYKGAGSIDFLSFELR